MLRIITLAILLLTSTMCAAEPTTKPAPPYNDKADATVDIDKALQLAKQKNQRVLLNVGGNWCSWCLRLHELFLGNEKISSILKENYQVVYVDAGKGDKNLDVLVFYGLTVKSYPHLGILDADGNLITQQDAEIFESKGKHNPDQVAAFLEKHKAPAK